MLARFSQYLQCSPRFARGVVNVGRTGKSTFDASFDVCLNTQWKGFDMGFAKYNEDIVSRYVNDTRNRATSNTPQEIQRHPDTKGKKQMSGLKQFQMTTARPLPVIVLADVSGSMGSDGKIEALNAALKEMVKTFAEQSRLRAEIHVSLITFGEVAKMHVPLTPANQAGPIAALQATGRTPMGAAFELATALLEDREQIPSRAYRPVLVLVSDGHPTDDWQEPFARLQGAERAQKAVRYAMAIGADADEAMLAGFANDPEAPLFKAHNARDIQRFFRAVTMSVSVKSQSPVPDQATAFVIPDAPDDDPMDIEY
jgi:uncharacterized protein YegL